MNPSLVLERLRAGLHSGHAGASVPFPEQRQRCLMVAGRFELDGAAYRVWRERSPPARAWCYFDYCVVAAVNGAPREFIPENAPTTIAAPMSRRLRFIVPSSQGGS